MAYVNVDVDLDEFETYEICDELVRRLRSYGRKELTEKQKSEIREEISSLSQKIGFSFSDVSVSSLNDKMKADFIMSIWDKYTIWELENLLKK